MKRLNPYVAQASIDLVNPVKRLDFHHQQPLILSRATRQKQLPESRVFEIGSIHDLKEITDFLPPGSLVASDLDNMLMEPVQLIGSDQWFEAMMTHLMGVHAGDKAKVYAELIPLYNNVHKHTEVKAVEPHTPLFMHRLQAKHKACALTTRGKELADATERQLHSIDIKFNHSGAHKDQAIDLPHIGHASKIHNGIIFAGGRDKGVCLKEYMKEMGYDATNTPHILFLDDKPHHVENVRKAAAELGIKFTGVRYGHLDEKIKDVDLEVAKIQHAHHVKFGKFPSDDEAKEIIRERSVQGKKKNLKMKVKN